MVESGQWLVLWNALQILYTVGELLSLPTSFHGTNPSCSVLRSAQ